MNTPRGLAALTLLIAVTTLAPPAAVAERVDPFYLRLLRDGEAEYQRGEIAPAAVDLRLACFGTLDDPPVLARCLVFLAMAQAKLGERRAFDETVVRLLDAEERLGAYSAADLPAAVGEEFRAHVDAWVPEETLRQYAAFAPLVERKRAARLAGLSNRELAVELQRLIALEPEQPRWALMLARLELDRGDHQAALDALGGLAPELSTEIPCLRGQALSGVQRCDEAVAELERCAETPSSGALQEATLSCRVALGRWAEASHQLAGMDAEVRGRSGVGRLVRRIERERPAPPADEPSGSANGVASLPVSNEGELPAAPDGPATTESRDPPVGAEGDRPATDLEIARLRQRLANAKTAMELEATYEAVRVPADRPGAGVELHFLAAEIAYRLSRWDEAVHYFGLGGDPGEGSPDLLFYLAVALYERGDRERATATLERCLPHLKTTPFVASYRQKILGS